MTNSKERLSIRLRPRLPAGVGGGVVAAACVEVAELAAEEAALAMVSEPALLGPHCINAPVIFLNQSILSPPLPGPVASQNDEHHSESRGEERVNGQAAAPASSTTASNGHAAGSQNEPAPRTLNGNKGESESPSPSSRNESKAGKKAGSAGSREKGSSNTNSAAAAAVTAAAATAK